MIIKTSEFVTSAVNAGGYPPAEMPEIAFIGRSNVGKSTIINSITGRHALAKVSNTPGRTRLVNFFKLNNEIFLVDLPGYGYAKVSKKAKEVFGTIVEEYFTKRINLKRVVLLVDSRHKPTEDDVLMYNYLKHFNLDVRVVATKLDKLKRNEIKKNEKLIKDTLGIPLNEEIIMYSSLTKENREKVVDKLFEGLIEEAPVV